MYGDFMMQVDRTVERVLEALDEAGMAEDTLVFFSSDNGPVWYETDVEKYGHSSTGPLRGMKADSWEGGHRVPFLARWPGKIPAGAVSGQLLCFTDLMATIAAILDAPMPAGEEVDSVSMAPALLGQDDGRPLRSSLLIKETATVIREGDWKLITHLGSGGFSKPRNVEPFEGGPRGQLYNLAEDIEETDNLWRKRPEIVERLTKMLDQYQPKAESAP